MTRTPAQVAKRRGFDLRKLRRAYYLQAHFCESGLKVDREGTVVEMRLTFDEWLALWLLSGHLKDRGLGKDKYCMSRTDDLGHYEFGNVQIVTQRENGQGIHGWNHGVKMPVNFTCFACGRSGWSGAMARHHGENCRPTNSRNPK